MSYTIVEDGDTLQVRASIKKTAELAEFIERLTAYYEALIQKTNQEPKTDE